MVSASPMDTLIPAVMLASWGTSLVMLGFIVRDRHVAPASGDLGVGPSRVARPSGWSRNQVLVTGTLIMLPQVLIIPFAAWVSLFVAFLAVGFRIRQIRDRGR